MKLLERWNKIANILFNKVSIKKIFLNKTNKNLGQAYIRWSADHIRRETKITIATQTES